MSNVLEVSYIEMARQTSGYLVAVAGSVLAIFGIAAAIPGRCQMPRSYGMRAFSLVLCCLAGAHYMSQVVAYDSGNQAPLSPYVFVYQLSPIWPALILYPPSPETPEVLTNQVLRSFLIAAITVYASLVGFFEVLTMFTRAISGIDERRVNGYLKCFQIGALVLLAAYLWAGDIAAMEILKPYPDYATWASWGAFIGVLVGVWLSKSKPFVPSGPVPASVVVQGSVALVSGFMMLFAVRTEYRILSWEVFAKNLLVSATIVASAFGVFFLTDPQPRGPRKRSAREKRLTVHCANQPPIKLPARVRRRMRGRD